MEPETFNSVLAAAPGGELEQDSDLVGKLLERIVAALNADVVKGTVAVAPALIGSEVVVYLPIVPAFKVRGERFPSVWPSITPTLYY